MHLLPPQQPVVPPLRSLLPAGGSPHCPMFFPQEPPEAGREREEEQEEEQAFLVSLYTFMKERRTPIERVPHLGFKQSASPGCRHGGGAGRGPPSGATPTCHRGCAQKGCPLQALAWQWVRPDVHPYRPHRVRSAQPSWCPCLGICWFCASLTGPWGQGAACPLLPPRLTGAPPPLIPS